MVGPGKGWMFLGALKDMEAVKPDSPGQSPGLQRSPDLRNPHQEGTPYEKQAREGWSKAEIPNI